ncbi:DUF2790 domain-containing protein [Pseudomonas sp. AL03]|uniref:DUF2790 domain-containing protein n=1 Tax=Pseudomonas sp. AL03 TaxID=3042230 RepID=UPI00249A1645|nr:DUF2790 domain-containing protein [Pseudomonas sp. AL03]MDI3273581.1 DUF2790 domain-containing protein [Pseudomonas sp. AL03]
MKVLSAGIAIAIAVASFAVRAEGGGDRVYNRTMQENQHAMEQYAINNGKDAPEIVHYKYGLDLDVVKMVNRTPATNYCGLVRSRMTYEDSNGKLNTIEYQVLGSNCPHGS